MRGLWILSLCFLVAISGCKAASQSKVMPAGYENVFIGMTLEQLRAVRKDLMFGDSVGFFESHEEAKWQHVAYDVRTSGCCCCPFGSREETLRSVDFSSRSVSPDGTLESFVTDCIRDRVDLGSPVLMIGSEDKTLDDVTVRDSRVRVILHKPGRFRCALVYGIDSRDRMGRLLLVIFPRLMSLEEAHPSMKQLSKLDPATTPRLLPWEREVLSKAIQGK